MAYRSWAVDVSIDPVERELWRQRAASTLLMFPSTSTSPSSPLALPKGGPLTTDLGCPYKGLASYEDSEFDVRFFFGREREREIIAPTLMASKLTVLYGDTGVGKSSVLRAGVGTLACALGATLWRSSCSMRLEGRPGLAGLIAALAASAGIERRATLADTLQACAAKLDGDVYVILDGVEEYFLDHEGETGPGTFFSELPEAVKRPGLRASFLLAIREDALARLDRFKASIPNLFGTTCDFPILIGKPRGAPSSAPSIATTRSSTPPSAWRSRRSHRRCARRGRHGPRRPRPDRSRRRAGSTVRRPHRGAVPSTGHAPAWEAEEEAGSHILRTSTLEALGGAEEIVRAHLGRALEPLTVEQKDIAAAVFNHLVTPSGTKIAHAVPDLARYAGVPDTDLKPVLATLSRERILRPAAANGGAPRYEIYHDVLGEAVLAWRTAHEAEREVEGERERAAGRHRRLLALLGAGGVLLAVMTGVSVYALVQRGEARTQARTAQARQLDSRPSRN